MKRLWHLLTVFSLVLAPVLPVARAAEIPAAAMSCCGPAGACDTRHSVPCPDQPARECAACPLSCASGCLAVLSAADLPLTSFSPVAGLEPLAEKGLQRADPPQLPPPRGLG